MILLDSLDAAQEEIFAKALSQIQNFLIRTGTAREGKGNVQVMSSIFAWQRGLSAMRWLGSSILATKINTVVILSTAAATLSILFVGTAGLTAIFAQQNYNLFTAKLSGSNEVPPVTTSAYGIATFQLVPVAHQQVMSYRLSVKNITGVTGAQINSGKQGENGPVVAVLFKPSNPTGPINGLLTAGTLTSSELTGPLHGKLSLCISEHDKKWGSVR